MKSRGPKVETSAPEQARVNEPNPGVQPDATAMSVDGGQVVATTDALLAGPPGVIEGRWKSKASDLEVQVEEVSNGVVWYSHPSWNSWCDCSEQVFLDSMERVSDSPGEQHSVPYEALPDGGGFPLDRPQTLAELRQALSARFRVAERKLPDAGIEDFYFRQPAHLEQEAVIEKYLQEGRIITYGRPGDNEGYIVQVLVSPAYFDNGPVIPVAHSKCWTREGALALLGETSELMLRW